MDNRHALIVDCRVTQALGADKNYDTKGMVAELRRIGVTPHVTLNTSRPAGSAIDGRTSRHEGYAKSIHARRGTEKVSAVFGLHVIAYNLICLGNLLRPAIAAA
jgi:IS5 family transposase